MKKKNMTLILISALCIMMLVPLLVIGHYDRPTADDYDYAIQTSQVVQNGGDVLSIIKAAWDTDIRFYNSWQGLYTSAFILALQPGIYGESYYSLTPYIIIFLVFLSLLVSISIINKHFIKRSKLFVCTASLFVLTFLMLWLPSPTQGLYWYNGAMNYMPFVFADLLNICLLVEILKEKSKNIKCAILIVITAILSFLISGGNHVTSFANILILLFFTVYCCHKEKRFFATIPLIVAIIGFVIMCMAPGTAIRRAALSHDSSVIESVIQTLISLRGLSGKWISLIWVLSIVIISPTAQKYALNNKTGKKEKFPVIPLVIFGIIICGMLCVPIYSMGGYDNGRITNVIWITFVFLSWWYYFLFVKWLVSIEFIPAMKLPDNVSNKARKVIFIIAPLAIMICLFVLPQGSNNSSSLIACYELYCGKAQSYCEQIDERIRQYNDNSLKEVVVEPIKNKSNLLFFSDIGTDPTVWPNTSISKYYNKVIYLNDSGKE